MKENTFLGKVIVATIDRLGSMIPQKAFYRIVEGYMFNKKLDVFEVHIRPTKDILEDNTVSVQYFEHRCDWYEDDESKKQRKRSGRYNLS